MPSENIIVDNSISDVLTRQEAANYLRISLRKLDYLSHSGQIPYVKMGPRKVKGVRVLFRKRDLDAYVEKHLVAAKASSPKAKKIAEDIFAITK